MIRTTIGIALLILIAIYGLMFLRRESFTSTINFVTVIDAFQKMTDEEKAIIMDTGGKVMEKNGKYMRDKMTATLITNEDAAQIIDTIYKSINSDFQSIINKYKFNTADIVSLIIYAFAMLMIKNESDPEITPVVKQNMETLAKFVKTWNPDGKGLDAPSVSLAPPPTLANPQPTASASIVPTVSAAPAASASTPISASSSLFTGGINEIIKGAVRDELKTMANKPTAEGRFAYAPGTSFAYDSGVTQKWQENAACNARDWCCRCRRPRHKCNCQDC
jgi:hypothetical protein